MMVTAVETTVVLTEVVGMTTTIRMAQVVMMVMMEMMGVTTMTQGMAVATRLVKLTENCKIRIFG